MIKKPCLKCIISEMEESEEYEKIKELLEPYLDMMKPINLFGVFFAEDLGNIVALTFQNLLPILIIGSVMIKPP